MRRPLTTGRAAQIIASATLLITIFSGILMHFTDERTYPNIGDAFGGPFRPSRRSAMGISARPARPGGSSRSL